MSIDLSKFGSVIMLIGRMDNAQDFKKNMAKLLDMLMSTEPTRYKGNITVTVVSIEQYVTSDTR